MQDKKGPLGKPLLPLEQFQRSLLHEQASVWDKSVNNVAISLLHLPQRISNIEQYLGMNQGNQPYTEFSIHSLCVGVLWFRLYQTKRFVNKSFPIRNSAIGS